MVNQWNVFTKTLLTGVIIIFINLTSVNSSAIIINDDISTNNEFLLTNLITRHINEKPTENIELIENYPYKDNESNYQPFEKIIPIKNHKNVNDFKGNSRIFYPTDDTYIEKSNPNKNHGSLNYFSVATSYNGYYDYDSLLRFNLSSINPHKEIFAKLYIYYYYCFDKGFKAEYSLYRVVSDWDEDNVTWNNKPSYVSTPTDTLIVPFDTGVWLEFDVTEDVRNFIDGKYINYGWIISDDDYCSQWTDLRQSFIYSKEFSNGKFIPYLVVNEPETIYVDDDNVNGPWNGTKEYPFQNIQDGLDNCFCGDTVYVLNGTYNESVVIYEDYINLIGESKNDTFIISKKERWVVLVRDRCYGATISGFTISLDSNNAKGETGIALDCYSYDNYVTDNIIVNNIIGVLLWYDNDYNFILNNTILNCETGIWLRGICYYNIISNNTIKDVDDEGISITVDASYNVVSYNNISNTETGIYLDCKLLNNIVSNNLLKNNYYGIYATYLVYDISITRNIITGNEYGIYIVLCILYGNISGNEINRNTCGIYCSDYWDATKNFNIYNNNITDNNYKGGIFIDLMKNCEVFCNNFINNKRSARFLTCFLDYHGFWNYFVLRTKWFNNYWDDLKGSFYWIYGRIGFYYAHPFPWINIDWHPAKEPYDI